MRRVALSFAFLTAFAGCDDPITCPTDPPFEAGTGMLPPTIGGGHTSARPVSCGYFDRCGETVCTHVDDGWQCVRDDASPGNCDDAGANDE